VDRNEGKHWARENQIKRGCVIGEGIGREVGG